MTDLAEFDGLATAQENGIDVSIVHPKTGESLGITIKVAGPESDRQKKMKNRIMNERLISNRNRRMKAEEIDSDAIKLSVASIISWSGIEIGSVPLEFNVANATMLLTKYPFIREQIDTAVSDRAAFLKD